MTQEQTLTRHKAAKKAHRTRKAREMFRDAYPQTYDIAEMLIKGYTTQEISEELWVETSSVAAILAHLNRPGTFSTLANNCNF